MTHKERTLEYMRRFGSISSMEAFRDLGNTRLSATIYSLRKDGYEILSTKEQSKNRFGEKTTYDRYYLKGETPKDAPFKEGDRVRVRGSILQTGTIVKQDKDGNLVEFDDKTFISCKHSDDELELFFEGGNK